MSKTLRIHCYNDVKKLKWKWPKELGGVHWYDIPKSKRPKRRKWLSDEQRHWCLEHLSKVPHCMEWNGFEGPFLSITFAKTEDANAFQQKWLS